jgi:hypothetical protein
MGSIIACPRCTPAMSYSGHIVWQLCDACYNVQVEADQRDRDRRRDAVRHWGNR